MLRRVPQLGLSRHCFENFVVLVFDFVDAFGEVVKSVVAVFIVCVDFFIVLLYFFEACFYFLHVPAVFLSFIEVEL